MEINYVKYREFLRHFKEFRDSADPNTVYEIIGEKGASIGYFSLINPYEKGIQKTV